MRILFSFFITIFLIFLSGCSSDSPPVFVMNLEADFKIPAGLNTLDTHYFVLRGVPTFSRTYVNNQEGRDAISGVFPSRAEINARFDRLDWAIIQEISIWAVSASDSSIKREIFYENRIDFSNVRELKLSSSLSEVKDILFQDQLTLEVRIRLRNITPFEIDTRLTMNFDAHGSE